MKFNVKTLLKDNILECRVEPELNCKENQFYYYLRRNNENISRIGWTENNNAKWTLEEDGIYSVRAFLKRSDKKVAKTSYPINYFSEETKKSFNEFVNSEMDKSYLSHFAENEFYKLQYPYKDFAIIFGEADVENIKKDGLYFHEFDKIESKRVVFLSSEPIEKKEKITYYFSGTTKYDKKLIWGENDIPRNIDVRNLSDGIGNFHLIFQDDKGITLTTDYFGVSKLFYFHKDGLFVASNRYHLLLLTLKNLGISMSLNMEKISANLCHSSQIFQQNFSREMEIKDVYVLPIDTSVTLSKNGVIFKEKPIHQILYNPPQYNEEVYKEVLEQGVNEVIENVQVALEHPGFDKVIIDLTGGMDSRMVYAAATNIPQHKEKIYINSMPRNNLPNELPVALEINSIYGYPFCSFPTIVEHKKLYDLENDFSSYHLGTYYAQTNIPLAKNQTDSILRLKGGYGEICLRPYYARQYLNTSLEELKEEEFLDEIISRYTTGALNDKTMSALKNQFKKELSLLPGRTPLEKLDLHYLYYRNGLHFNDSLLNDINYPTWGPLQSKSLFYLKMMCFEQHKNIKLQLDAMNQLNPLLAAIPYEREEDNEEKERIENLLYYKDLRFKNIKLPLNSNQQEWEESRVKQMDNIQYLPSDTDQRREIQQANYRWKNDFSQRFFSLLHELMQFKEKDFQNDFGIDIYNKLTNNDFMSYSEHQKKMLYNKLVSIYYQIKIISD